MIKPEEIARLYVGCVEMEDWLRGISSQAADEAGELRAELHALLMQAFHDAGIPLTDRADAARQAFQLAAKTTV